MFLCRHPTASLSARALYFIWDDTGQLCKWSRTQTEDGLRDRSGRTDLAHWVSLWDSKLLHHAVPNSLRKGTCRYKYFFGNLVLCCLEKKKWLCSNMTLEKKNSSLRGCVIVPPCSSWRIISGWQRCSARGWLMWIWCPYGKRPVVLFYTPLFSNGIGLHKTMAHCWHSSRLLIGLTFAEFRGYSFE